MKKNTMKLFALLLSGLTLASCGKEASGSVIKFDSQLDALTQLKNGTVDVAIIDSVMAGYYTSKGDFASSLQTVDGLILSQEQYGIAGRKEDVAFMDKINEALIGITKNGKFAEIAEYFGVTSSIAIDSNQAYTASGTDNSFTEICNSGKITIGYTIFAPIAYTDATNNYSGNEFTGFDTEIARATIAYINETYSTNLQVEFQEIDWDSKEVLLSNGTIDLIWNGLTITDERKAQMSISIPYLNNNQVAVILKSDASKYTSKDDIKKATIGVESGSAGEDIANEIVG